MLIHTLCSQKAFIMVFNNPLRQRKYASMFLLIHHTNDINSGLQIKFSHHVYMSMYLTTGGADNAALVNLSAMGIDKGETSTSLQVIKRNGRSNVPAIMLVGYFDTDFSVALTSGGHHRQGRGPS